VTINPDAKLIRVSVTLPEPAVAGQPPYQLTLRMDSVTYGLPMLAALVAVTRAESWAAKLRALFVGLTTMLLLTVPVVMLWAKLASLQLEERLAPEMPAAGGDRASVVYYLFHGYAFSQPVVAIAVWLALVMLGLFKAKAAKPAHRPDAAIARNAPCPCGSRRKYKRCCGRA
jgi:SEC-C motif